MPNFERKHRHNRWRLCLYSEEKIGKKKVHHSRFEEKKKDRQENVGK